MKQVECVKKIGIVLRSSSHVDYTVQVLNPRDELSVSDYSLGRFLSVGDRGIVGVVYDTEVFNPNLLTISSHTERPSQFIPDLLNEVDILLKVLVLGKIETGKNYGNQEFPPEPLEAGTAVFLLEKNNVLNFHFDENKRFQMRYLTNLKEFGSKLNPGLFRRVSSQLKEILKEKNMEREVRLIDAIERDLMWERLYNC